LEENEAESEGLRVWLYRDSMGRPDKQLYNLFDILERVYPEVVLLFPYSAEGSMRIHHPQDLSIPNHPLRSTGNT